MIYSRPLDSFEAAPVAGTDGARSPLLSPDGAWVGFAFEGKLRKVPIGGGVPVVICELDRNARVAGASWAPEGWIVFSDGHRLLRVRDSGGAWEEIVPALKRQTRCSRG